MSGFKRKALWVAVEEPYRNRISKDPAVGTEQVRKIISDCAEMGFNTIYPCVRTHDNSTSYDSKIETNYYGWDLLTVMCEASKAAGLEMHPWFCFWGDVARENPELHAVGYNGSEFYPAAGNHRWLCPLRPESQEYMMSLIDEIIEYPADGFHLDFIRYFAEPCYCDYHRDQFRSKFGQDPIELDESSDLWDAWNKFNSDAMTDFVGRVSEKVRAKGKKVSAAVFQVGRQVVDSPYKVMPLDRCAPGKEMGECHHDKRYFAMFQDWPTWCRKGYLDQTATMQYTKHLDMVEESIEGGLKAAVNTEFMMGLGFIRGQTIDTLIPQIEACRRSGVDVCFFDYFNLMAWSEQDRKRAIDCVNA